MSAQAFLLYTISLDQLQCYGALRSPISLCIFFLTFCGLILFIVGKSHYLFFLNSRLFIAHNMQAYIFTTFYIFSLLLSALFIEIELNE